MKKLILPILAIVMLSGCGESKSYYTGWAVAVGDYIPGRVNPVGYTTNSVAVTYTVNRKKYIATLYDSPAMMQGDSVYIEEGKPVTVVHVKKK